jgi:hypothetical protein
MIVAFTKERDLDEAGLARATWQKVTQQEREIRHCRTLPGDGKHPPARHVLAHAAARVGDLVNLVTVTGADLRDAVQYRAIPLNRGDLVTERGERGRRGGEGQGGGERTEDAGGGVKASGRHRLRLPVARVPGARGSRAVILPAPRHA